MSVLTKSVHDAYILYDAEHTHRWYDAWGPGVTKYVQDMQGIPVDNTTRAPTQFVITLVGASTVVPTDVGGGAILLTTAGADNDGVKMQLGGVAGESVGFLGAYPTYFGVQFQASVVTQADFLFGVCVTDTTCLDGVDTGMYFRNIDASALLYFVTEKDTVESQTAVATLAVATPITCEWYFDGATVYAYINGAQVCSVAATDATFPNDELMRLTMEFLTGDNAAITCTINWIRLIQVRR